MVTDCSYLAKERGGCMDSRDFCRDQTLRILEHGRQKN